MNGRRGSRWDAAEGKVTAPGVKRGPIPADPAGERRADYLALLCEVGMIPGSWRPGISNEDRLRAGHQPGGGGTGGTR